MLNLLETKQILHIRDVTNIKNMIHEEEKINLLFKIFRDHRRPIDFIIFCRLLQKYGVLAVEEFGKDMENKLK